MFINLIIFYDFFFRGAVLIMGAILLNTIIVALLYHPVEQHMKEVPDEGIDNEGMAMEEESITEDTNKSTQSITDLSAPAISKTDTTNTSTNHLADLSKVLEKTLTMPDIDEIEITKFDQDKNTPDDLQKNEKNLDNSQNNEIEDKLPTQEVNSVAINCEIENIKSTNSAIGISTPSLSRNNSIRKSNKSGFHLTRQHSIVSEMGPIALTPKMNVPSMFRRLFKTQSNSKKRNSNAKNVTIIADDIEKTKQPDKKKISVASSSSPSSSSGSSNANFFDLSLLKDPIYLVILISNSTSAISNTNFMILLPSYAISEGFDKNMAALLLSIVSALDLVGRIGGASLSDIDFIPKYYYFVCGLGMSGVALALLPMATTYTMLSFFCALFGLSSGMYIGITTVILADMLGTEKLSSSYGISLFVNGVLQLIGPPICGVIFEKVGTYKPIFLTFGIILILGTALWALVPIFQRRKNKLMLDVV